MSSFTAPAFVAYGDYGPESRKHPALRFMEALVHEFYDTRDHSKYHDWFAEDFSSIRIDGKPETKDRKEAFEHARQFHLDLLTEYRHIPFTQIAIDDENGWKTFHQVEMFANLPGERRSSEKKVKDPYGKEWDVMVPQHYQFDLIKDPKAKHHGILVQHIRMIYDSAEVKKALDHRGFESD